MSVLPSVRVWVQVGGRLILLICESRQRPLEDASVSRGVTYTYIVRTREGRIQVQGCVAETTYTGSICFLGSHVDLDLKINGSTHQNLNDIKEKMQLISVGYSLNIMHRFGEAEGHFDIARLETN